MEIKIVELDENYAKLKIKGEDHTFLNLLQHYLLENEHVLFAKYDIPHPLIQEAELIVRTDGMNPMEALRTANEMIISECDSILEEI
jgi:DNA-directed RNA polymerase subunit L